MNLTKLLKWSERYALRKAAKLLLAGEEYDEYFFMTLKQLSNSSSKARVSLGPYYEMVMTSRMATEQNVVIKEVKKHEAEESC